MRKLISPSLYQPTTLLLLQNSKDLSNYSTSSKLSPMLLPSCLSPDGWVSSGDWSPCRSVEISWSVSESEQRESACWVYNGTRPSSPPVTHIMGRHHRAQRPVQVTWESGHPLHGGGGKVFFLLFTTGSLKSYTENGSRGIQFIYLSKLRLKLLSVVFMVPLLL